MQDERIITREDQAKALQDVGFLSRFLAPASPSDVAKDIDMPANLAHHHAKRHASLGLLEEVSREGGKVYYQLAARTFKHRRNLLPNSDPDGFVTTNLERLRERFLDAYERSDHLAGKRDPDWTTTVFGFSGGEDGSTLADAFNKSSPEPHPAHFQAHTLRLSSENYQALVRKIAQFLYDAGSKQGSGPCTLAFLAFDGVLSQGVPSGHCISSFVSLDKDD